MPYPLEKLKKLYEKMDGLEKFSFFIASINDNSYSTEELDGIKKGFEIDFSENKKSAEKNLQITIQRIQFMDEFIKSLLKTNLVLLQIISAVTIKYIGLQILSAKKLSQQEAVDFLKGLEELGMNSRKIKEDLVQYERAKDILPKETMDKLQENYLKYFDSENKK